MEDGEVSEAEGDDSDAAWSGALVTDPRRPLWLLRPRATSTAGRLCVSIPTSPSEDSEAADMGRALEGT